MALHKVHCPRCGEIIEASALAFDFGELINIALEKMKNRYFGANEEWYDLTGLNLCLYLTLADLINIYGFKTTNDGTFQGTFQFTTERLGEQLVKIANTPNASVELLASTTNPKEYIQRRGRVLRLAKDKPYAVIYDFVTLTEPMEDVNPYSPDFNCEKALAKRELQRIKEFGKIAKNARDSDELINDIEVTFGITEKETEEAIDGDEFE